MRTFRNLAVEVLKWVTDKDGKRYHVATKLSEKRRPYDRFAHCSPNCLNIVFKREYWQFAHEIKWLHIVVSHLAYLSRHLWPRQRKQAAPFRVVSP